MALLNIPDTLVVEGVQIQDLVYNNPNGITRKMPYDGTYWGYLDRPTKLCGVESSLGCYFCGI